MTNGDKIRAMTDEELESWLCSMQRDCTYCPAASNCPEPDDHALLGWLKQEAE